MQRHLVTLSAVACCAVTPAFADEGDAPPKAHLTCTSGAPLRSAKAARLGDAVTCALAVDSLGGYKAGDLRADFVLDVDRGSTLGRSPRDSVGSLAPGADGALGRESGPFVVDQDYKRCEPFTITASLNDLSRSRAEDMQVWHQALRVKASCPPPRKVPATLTCSTEGGDGTYRWPGNGVKVKPRLENPVTCVIRATTTEPGVAYQVGLGVAGKPVTAQPFDVDAAGGHTATRQFGSDDYETCVSFGVVGEIRADGKSLWRGKLAITQDCPD
jgi:hypothetical protein